MCNTHLNYSKLYSCKPNVEFTIVCFDGVYFIKKAGDKNKDNHQPVDIVLISHQILKTNFEGNL